MATAAFHFQANAQYISRIVGNGSGGYSGDGGPAVLAKVSAPTDLVVTSTGTIYFCDCSNHVIRKVTTSGVISTIAGNGTSGSAGDGGAATAANLDQPFSLAITSSGIIYFVDINQHTVRKISSTGIITKVAGTAGTAGYTGDGGAATAARLNGPIGIVLDASGNIYISDSGNQVVRKISTSGLITTIAGNGSAGYSGDGGAATAASLNGPTGLAIDGSGNLYIADFYNSCIRKRTSAGIISTLAGTGTAGFSGDGGPATSARLQYPEEIAVDASGNMLISDKYNNRIRYVNSSGIITTVCGNGTAGYGGEWGFASYATISYPLGLKLDAAGNLYFCDAGNNYIRKINSGIRIGIYQYGYCSGDTARFAAFIFSTAASPHYQWQVNGRNVGTDTPYFSTTSLANADYVTCQLRNGSVSGTLIATSDTSFQFVSTTPRITLGSNPVICVGDTIANLNYSTVANKPSSMTVTWDTAAISHGFARQVYGAIISTVAGDPATTGSSGNGGPATAARFNGLGGMVFDAAGNLFVADASNNVIRKIDTFGIVTTIAGTGTAGNTGDYGMATSANMSPYFLAIDASGNLYFTDSRHHVIRKINSAGIITTIAGTGTAGYAGDGSAATAALLYKPNGIAISRSGEIYFADYGNNVVRKIDASGVITTLV